MKKTTDIVKDMKNIAYGGRLTLCADDAGSEIHRAIDYSHSAYPNFFTITYDGFTGQITIERQ